MQQQYVLAELEEHLANHPVDAPSTALVLRYLRVLNALFEEGFLSHEVIRLIDSPTLLTMQSAFNFLVQWLESLIVQGLVPTSPFQKSFLSWQTWDLMRVCWNGFYDYCQEFLQDHPEHYVTPLRGSAIETIFSQLKHASRGSLTAVTYESARAQLLTCRNVHGPRTRDNYRDAPIYVKESELPLKKRPRK
jgi:hypothetical protein